MNYDESLIRLEKSSLIEEIYMVNRNLFNV